MLEPKFNELRLESASDVEAHTQAVISQATKHFAFSFGMCQDTILDAYRMLEFVPSYRRKNIKCSVCEVCLSLS